MSEPLRIFLSYRREDASGHAGRLYDVLAAEFGAENVFMDIDTIDLGADFVAVITEAVASCDVLIALIGRQWLSARLENPDDFVRLEIEAALKRDVFVIPAYVQGVSQPTSEQLPEGLGSLARRQGTQLRDVGWRDDVSRLISRLQRLGREKAGRPEAPVSSPLRSRKILLAFALVPVALATAAAALFAFPGEDKTRPVRAESLRAAIPPVTRPSCHDIPYGEKAALRSLECAGARLAVTYHLFPSHDVLNGWYTRQRELAGIAPSSGSCTAARFRGEVRDDSGTYFCRFVQGKPVLVWADDAGGIGAEANVYEGTGRTAVESLLRQWQCCLQVQH